MDDLEALYLAGTVTAALFLFWHLLYKPYISRRLRAKLLLDPVPEPTPEERAEQKEKEARRREALDDAVTSRLLLELFLENEGELKETEGQLRLNTHREAHATYVRMLGFSPERDTYYCMLMVAKEKLPPHPYGGYLFKIG